jgi:hypothetical protein
MQLWPCKHRLPHAHTKQSTKEYKHKLPMLLVVAAAVSQYQQILPHPSTAMLSQQPSC